MRGLAMKREQLLALGQLKQLQRLVLLRGQLQWLL